VAEKRGHFVPRKALNFKPTAVTEPDVSKKVKQCFFMPTPSKRPNNCQTMTCMPNHFQKAKFLEFDLKNANLATLINRHQKSKNMAPNQRECSGV